jgi:putative ABC transport system permease protein
LLLAWRNLLHDRTRLAVTVGGITFAEFPMIFEGSLLAGFLSAASKVVDSVRADLWITARGVPAFDFPAPLPERFRSMALGVDGVAEVYRLATGFGEWLKPDGSRQTVIVVGADPGAAPGLPRPESGGASVDEPNEAYCRGPVSVLLPGIW